MASIRTRRRSDGSKSFQVRADGIPTRTFDRKDDARRYAVEVERRRLLGSFYEAPPEAFGAFLDAYIDRKEASGSRPSTVKTLREVAAYLGPLRPRAIPELRRADVEDLVALVACRAPRRAQMALALVKAVLSAAQARGQTIDEAIDSIERPRHDEREPRFLTIEQLYELSGWMPEYIRRIVLVAGLTGMREGELLALRDDQLELDDGRLWIRHGKTRSSRRRVWLTAEVVSLLREQLLARPHARLGSSSSTRASRGVGEPAVTGTAPHPTRDPVRPGSHFVFPAPEGGGWDRNRFMSRVFRDARQAAGLDTVTFHDLRHTAVSIMALAGWRPEHIAAQIGHADGGALIYRRYRHLFAGEMETHTAALDELIRRREQKSARA